jgi:hypothetical protein
LSIKGGAERGIGAAGAAAITAVLLLAVFAGAFVLHRHRNESVKFETPYQAVLLTNGSVYFGKLENYGMKFPLLRDVYYVQTSVNQETKQATNVLVKRGKELHAPDRMYLSPNQIVFVEPVGAESKVAQLIAESKAKGQ